MNTNIYNESKLHNDKCNLAELGDKNASHELFLHYQELAINHVIGDLAHNYFNHKALYWLNKSEPN